MHVAADESNPATIQVMSREPPPRTPAWCRATAVSCAVFASCSGALGLAGWILDHPGMKSGFASDVTMKANTAVGLCLLGLSTLLALPARTTPLHGPVSRACATFAGALGALTLSQHLFGWDLGLDQALFSEPPGSPATASPGRMGPPASIAFMSLASALLLLDRRVHPRQPTPQWISIGVAAMTLLPLLGYFTGAETLYGIAPYTGIAMPTALALLALSVAVFLARPTTGPARVVLADDAGGHLARRMLPLTLLFPLLVGWVRAEGERQGFFDEAFGRALLLLTLMLTFTTVVWLVAARLSRMARAHGLVEKESRRATAEAERLAFQNVETLNVLDSLLQNAPIGLAFFDQSLRCVRANEFLAGIGGHSSHSRIGLHINDVLPMHTEEVVAAANAVFESGRSTAELEIAGNGEGSPDAGRSWLTGFFPVRGVRDGVTLVGTVIVETTERRRLEAQRLALLDSERAARVEAERAASLKDEFLATLSHELRTPLSAITGWVALARRAPDLPSDLERPLEIIERNAHVQAKLIEDLLDVSRIVSGKLRLEARDIDVVGVLHAAISAVTPAAEAKGLVLEAHLGTDSVTVSADPPRLQQIVWNLLSNAVKFTPKGGKVTVHVRHEAARLLIAVTDTGIGIRPEFLPHVFDRFRQADSTTTRHHGGLGLGLSIAKQLAEMHGGSVKAESPGENGGATFTLAIPLQAPAASLLAGAPRAWGEVALKDVRVLVVDDELDARDLVARVLRDHDAVVETAAGAKEALSLLARETMDVLVSDISMPGEDGYEFIRHVRQTVSSTSLPAIALTAFARPEDRQRALRAGFQLHVTKPVDAHELIQAVASLAPAR